MEEVNGEVNGEEEAEGSYIARGKEISTYVFNYFMSDISWSLFLFL